MVPSPPCGMDAITALIAAKLSLWFGSSMRVPVRTSAQMLSQTLVGTVAEGSVSRPLQWELHELRILTLCGGELLSN